MKKLGLLIYLLTNLYLGVVYIIDIREYFLDKFNFDGTRYLILIAIADIAILIVLILLYATSRFSKYLFILIGLALLHNVVMGMGVDKIPFIGLTTVIISSLYIYKLWSDVAIK